MAEEIAKLVDALSCSSGDVNLSEKLRSDSSLYLGFQKLYSILKYAVKPITSEDDTHTNSTKLGIELWDQSQIQALASLATAIVNATRSLSGIVFLSDWFQL